MDQRTAARDPDRLVLLGTLAGLAAYRLLLGRFPVGLRRASVVGIAGALVGGWLTSLLLSREVAGVDGVSFAIAVAGAALLIACSRYGRLPALKIAASTGAEARPPGQPRLVIQGGGTVPGGGADAGPGGGRGAILYDHPGGVEPSGACASAPMTTSRSRTRRLRVPLVAAVAGVVLLVGQVGAQSRGDIAYSLELSGTIDPATERWLGQALEDAAEEGARLAIVRLDTPGGLDTSMRSIVKEIVAAPMPVIVYVSPDGARAASAGLFITQAADVAAMAPQTNIGSATPVRIGPGEEDEVLGRKVRNDAAGYVRALAEGHGRNPDLAERMVRDAANVTAERARETRLVDVVAANERELLRALDGFEVRGPKAQTLDTDRLRIERHEMPLQLEALQLLVNPTIASLLLLAGLAGVAIEVFSPGAIAPGVLGAIALVLGLYGTAQLPVTAAGAMLLLLALALLAAETQVPSGGILGGAGVAALVAGMLLLYDTDSEAFAVSVPAVIAAGVLLAAFTVFAASKGLAARRRRARGGPEQLIGEAGVVRTALDPLGQVFVKGALWRARSADRETTFTEGERVEVKAVEGLTVTVGPTNGQHNNKESSS